MGLFNKRKQNNTFNTTENEVRTVTKLDKIRSLENERLELNRQIEMLAKRYARESGIKKLGRRRSRIGKAPNDWKDEYVSYK
jgi:hypothetical protein